MPTYIGQVFTWTIHTGMLGDVQGYLIASGPLTQVYTVMEVINSLPRVIQTCMAMANATQTWQTDHSDTKE